MKKEQDKLRKIHERAVLEMPQAILETPEEVSVLRRGYKIQYLKQDDIYLLFQTRTNDFYKYVEKEKYDLFVKDGMKVVADSEQVKRDEERIEKLSLKIAAADKQLNNTMVTHWKRQRKSILDRVVKIEDSLNSRL